MVAPLKVPRNASRARNEGRVGWHSQYKARSLKATAPSFAGQLGVRAVGEGFRISRPLRTGGYPWIVRREGWVRPLWLLVDKGGMAHCLCARRAFVARYERVIDGKRRRTHCPYQQRRGGKHGRYPLYSTQHTLLTTLFPLHRVFTHAGAGMVRCEKAGASFGVSRPTPFLLAEELRRIYLLGTSVIRAGTRVPISPTAIRG
jgi:hypothetical protein